jgi:hypothetical protein
VSTKTPTPQEIAHWLAKLGRQLDDAVEELGNLSDQAARATSDAEIAFARAFLEAEGQPMDIRRQLAVKAAADKRFEADLLNRRIVTQREAIKVLHSKVDTGRTASANVRAELSTLGTVGSAP